MARLRRQLARAAHAPAESAYVFVQASPAQFSRCFDRLFVGDGVCACDAVAGGWDLVLLLQAEDRQDLTELVRDHVASQDDVERFELHLAERPWLGEDLGAFIRRYDRMRILDDPAGERLRRDLVAAYAVAELDPSSLVAAYAQLYLDDSVVSCDLTRASRAASPQGGRSAVLLAQAATAQDLERALARLRAAPGVRELASFPIVVGAERSAGAQARRGAAP